MYDQQLNQPQSLIKQINQGIELANNERNKVIETFLSHFKEGAGKNLRIFWLADVT